MCARVIRQLSSICKIQFQSFIGIGDSDEQTSMFIAEHIFICMRDTSHRSHYITLILLQLLLQSTANEQTDGIIHYHCSDQFSSPLFKLSLPPFLVRSAKSKMDCSQIMRSYPTRHQSVFASSFALHLVIINIFIIIAKWCCHHRHHHHHHHHHTIMYKITIIGTIEEEWRYLDRWRHTRRLHRKAHQGVWSVYPD